MKTKININVIKIVAMMFLANLATGLFYFSTSALSPLIAQELKFTDSQLAILFSIPNLGFAVLGDLPGRVTDKLTPKRAVLISFAVVLLASIGKVFARSFLSFVVFTSIFSLGMVICTPASRTIIKELRMPGFEKIIVITSLGMTIGNWCSHTFSMLLAEAAGSWRVCYGIYCGVIAVIGALCAFLFLSGMKNYGPVETAPGVQAEEAMEDRRDYRAIRIFLMMMLVGVQGQSFALNSWLPKMLVSRGLPTTVSSLATSFYSMGTLTMSITISFLLPSLLRKKGVDLGAAAVIPVALVTLSGISATAGVAGSALAIGLGVGFQELFTNCMMVEHGPRKGSGRFVSAIYCAGNIGALVSINTIGAIPGDAMLPKVLFISCFTGLFFLGALLLARHLKNEKR